MLFRKRPVRATPMEQFLNRHDLTVDERAILDIYMTGVANALTSTNAVLRASNQAPLFVKADGDTSLEVAEMERIVEVFIKQRPDMKALALGLVAVTAVLQAFKP